MDGPPPQEEDFSGIPIADRLAHKNWKARVSAYEALIKIFQNTADDSDPAFKLYINQPDILKKVVTDSNAVAQEKGVECVITLVKFAGETAARTREVVVPALVDKCFGSARAGTRNQAVELTLQYVEVENNGAGVINDILPGLGAKQPKTVAGCVVALKEIIRLFGTQTVVPPPVLKALPKIFSHSDKTVRAEGTTLAHTLYQYIGAAIEPWLADLKPVQVKELKESFESMDKEGKGKGSLKPERLTRVQAREADTVIDAEGSEEDPTPEKPEDLDPRAFAEPVDITSKLPTTLQTALASSKWKERKEVLDELLMLLQATPRIKEAPELGEVVKSLAARISGDANINCVMVAASCMTEIAKGLMKSFSKYREVVVPPMLERLKERKTNVTDSIGAALDAVFATSSLSDVIPDLEPALKHKNPQVKEGTLKFLGRCIGTATTPILPAQMKPLAEALAILLEDGYEGARNEAATCLGTLMKMVGERPLNATMEGIADVRKVKVKEAFEKATVKCKSGGAPKPPPPAAPPAKKVATKAPPRAASPQAETRLVEDSPSKPLAKPPAKLMTKKSPVTAGPGPAPLAAPTAPVAAPVKKLPKATAPAAAKSSKAAANAPPGTLDSFKYKHTPEDAEALAIDLIPPSIMTDLADSNWKIRLAALEELSSWVEGVVDTADAEVIVRALAKKGWAEKNFQVSAKLYGILNILAEKSPTFGRSCVALTVSHLTEKLGDTKLKKPAGDALVAFAEKTSLQFVLNQAYEPLSKQKAPKVLADATTWIGAALTEFGIAGLSLRSLIDFLKSALGNSNAAVRTSATKTLVAVKLFAGSSIKDFLEDLNPQLLNTIISEFDKVEGDPAPEPIRTSADVAQMASSAPSGGKGAIVSDPMDDLFPRVELDGLLKGTTILSDSKNDAWKTKKEALEMLQALLDQGSNKRLKSGMGEIGQVLKARVTDTNKAVQSLALDIISRIATGMNKPFEKHARLFILPICTVLADQKAPIRAAALVTLSAIATACEGVDSMVPGITTGLETQNPLQKATLLHWIADWFKEHEPLSNLDLNSWAAPVVSSLDDRSGDVRKGAQAVLPTLITCTGYDYVLQQTNSLKPASRSTAIPLIQAARPVASVAAPPAPAPIALVKPTVKTPAASPPPISPSAESPAIQTQPAPKPSKLAGIRRKLPQGSSRPESRAETPVDPPRSLGQLTQGGLKKSSALSAPSPASSPGLAFSGANEAAKKTRTGKDAQKWINEGGPTRKDLADVLQAQMDPYTSKELLGRLFSKGHDAINDNILGLSAMCDFFTTAQADDAAEQVALANFDLSLKYISIKVHESQPNLVVKCLDNLEIILSFLRGLNYQLTDGEATCFVPTIIHKLGDPREQVRSRISQIVKSIPQVYPFSRVFQMLLDHGLRSKVAKTRQGALDEMAALLKRSGVGACEPNKAFPVIASMISDKDSSVRKSALSTLSEAYMLVGEKVWGMVGILPPKDKTQLEERLRRVPAPNIPEAVPSFSATAPAVTRIAGIGGRPASPSIGTRVGGLPRPASPAVPGASRLARPTSPAQGFRSNSPVPIFVRAGSPVPTGAKSNAPDSALPSSPTGISRPKSMLPSRLGKPRTGLPPPNRQIPTSIMQREVVPEPALVELNGSNSRHPPPEEEIQLPSNDDDITIIISSILSNDPSRSVDALKKIQKILSIGPEAGPSLPQYRELADHTEGLIETIALQMAHIFEPPENLIPEENFRLAKHLIQTLNNFCDHALLAESLTVDILTALLEELTLRLLETDDSTIKRVKDLSRFINMIILRLFATGRRMSIFRALFALLLRIVRPFPTNGSLAHSKEAKVAELVLKCVWKLARNIPQDLGEQHLDPVELFPAIEQFLQSVPPNEWRARATNRVPCGDMPLRTIKVIIQHVVAHYGDDVYDFLSAAFDDPSATIVYPYVYRILNSRATAESSARRQADSTRPTSPASSRPISPHETASAASNRHSHRSSSSVNGNGAFSPAIEEPDPDAQLLTIIGHISSETTGALHKEGITELHHFLKAHPHKRQKVDKMLESTGPAFRKYITRALASRAAEDEERNTVVRDTLSKLENEHGKDEPLMAAVTNAPENTNKRTLGALEGQEKLTRLHDIFQYRSSTLSTTSGSGSAPRTSG